MRILLTVHQFLPDFSAGTEIMTLGVARELIAHGHEVRIFTGFPGPAVAQPDESRFDRYLYEGIVIHRFTHAFVPMGGRTNIIELQHDNPLVAKFLNGLLEEFKPDLVHAFSLARLSASPIDICENQKIPFIFSAHDFWAICPTSQLLLPGNQLCSGPNAGSANCVRHLAALSGHPVIYQMPDLLVRVAGGLVRRRILPPTRIAESVRGTIERRDFLLARINRIARVIAPSRFMADMLARNGVAPQKITHLPNGVDPGDVQKTNRQTPTGPLRIGYLGTIAAHKGVHVILNALQHLKANATLTVYGLAGPDAAYVENIKQMAAADARMKFLPPVDHKEMGRILGELDVVVVPSLWYENAPLVIFEAQAAGCVVVASNLGGMAEAIRDNENGILFPPGDSKALAEALGQLAEDRAALVRLSGNAQSPISIERHVENLIELYQQVLAS